VVKPGRLFMVGTPIGNMGDFSFRGVETLRGAALVAAEDTRRTRKLLAHFGLTVPVVSLHAHSPDKRLERLLDRVARGEDVAFVTDAGTPGVSDPGGRLAELAHQRGVPVIPIPGPGAVLAALSASGLPADRFVFAGFLPRRGAGREAMLTRVAQEEWTTVLYESPARTAALLADLGRSCGERRPAVVARELTKLHEEVRRGTLAELAAYYGKHPPRGEVTVVVAGASPAGRRAPAGEGAAEAGEDTGALIGRLRSSGPPGEAARELARRLGISRKDAYRMLTGTGAGRRSED
jgi:16S rRNA (cytidine1402-2'-O)-methyltransferase